MANPKQLNVIRRDGLVFGNEVVDNAIKRVENGKLCLIPASEQTSGHGTVGDARFYKQQIQEFLQKVPQRTTTTITR
jgi:homoserine O-acetyltransferase/O-succinyltransferase